MRNKKVVEFVIYPRLFHSLCILYKGTYCVSFKIYHQTTGKTTTYGYPFILPHPKIGDSKEGSTLHVQSNFSFETERFEIIYEEDTKKLRNQGVFRLEYQDDKTYTTFLSCKLLKKIKADRKQTGLCTRAIHDHQFEVVDEQLFRIQDINTLNIHQKIYFHSSQFFSCIDINLCSFNQGFKWWKHKQQLSDILSGYTLSKCQPADVLKIKIEKEGKDEKERNGFSLKGMVELKEVSQAAVNCWEELIVMNSQYEFWYKEIVAFRNEMLGSIDSQGKKLAPLVLLRLINQTLVDLSHLERKSVENQYQLRRLFETENPFETLLFILEQKELLRCHIRAAREYYCTLLFYEPEKEFRQLIKKSERKQQKLKEEKFINFQQTLNEETGQILRSNASKQFASAVLLAPQKIDRMPFLLVQRHQEQHDMIKRPTTLTVFVHGYQGNSFDFQKSKNYLKHYNKNTIVLVVESITNQMEKSIEELGKKVAQEVIKHVDQALTRYQKINFVGFSLGGLIVRACLSQLGYLSKKLGIFVTFSSPHLGISDSDNNLVKLGVWYLIKVDKVKNLKELNFQSVKFQDSILMKLSTCNLISQFSNVILVSSKNDGFVPLYSTFLDEKLCQNQALILCKNLLSRITKLERVEVLFNTDHAGTIDKLTGRRGHIEFLDNHFFLQQFFRLYAPYF